MANSKIPFKRFYSGCVIIDENYFNEIEQITLDEVQSLSQHDLNKVPIAWLYDFAEAHNLLSDADIRGWIEEQRCLRKRARSLQMPKGKNQVILSAIERGKRIYSIKGWEYYGLADGLLYREGYGDTRVYAPTTEQIKRLNDILRLFIADYENAKAEHDGFKKVVVDCDTLYLRRKEGFNYHFIIVRQNGFIYQRTYSVIEFLQSTFLWKTNDKHPFDINSNIWQMVQDGTFPLLHIGDEYLAREIKYHCDCATEDEIIWLNSVSRKSRFIKTKEVYDACDFEVTKYRAQFYKWSSKIRGLEINGLLCGQKVTAYWEFGDTLNVCAVYKSNKVCITPELKQVLQQLLDDERARVERIKNHQE